MKQAKTGAVPGLSRAGSRAMVLLLVAAGALTSCHGAREEAGEEATGEGETVEAPALPEAARAALDSGNAAYRHGRYDEALARYREVAAAAPEHPAGHFGVYMAAAALGDSMAAESALARVRQSAAGSAALMIHTGSGVIKEAHPDTVRSP